MVKIKDLETNQSLLIQVMEKAYDKCYSDNITLQELIDELKKQLEPLVSE
ncbi:hypothetical protein ACFPM4_16405 [Lederbergia graminis]|uniref:Uncharacterized protein n=1 Tax=Lederbergia graminis TaxID=735518 RepID=A0ABW0LMQ9_9BACI